MALFRYNYTFMCNVGALPIDRRFYLESSLMTVLSNVNCSGSEQSLVECPSISNLFCPEQQTDAGVVCQSISLEGSNCSTGDVRLVNGSNSLEGRVEICFNGAWGTVCNRQFDQDVAAVICHQLNYTTNGNFLYSCHMHGHVHSTVVDFVRNEAHLSLNYK